MEESCIFCLDPFKQNPTSNPIGCSCKIIAHESCIHAWYHQKQQVECPICHVVAIQNPVVVYVQLSDQQQERQISRATEKAIAFCCCMLILWAISLSIIDFLFRN